MKCVISSAVAFAGQSCLVPVAGCSVTEKLEVAARKLPDIFEAQIFPRVER
jgi:hypothetical protein